MAVKSNLKLLSELVKSNEVHFTTGKLDSSPSSTKNVVLAWLESNGFQSEHIENEYVEASLSEGTSLIFVKLYVAAEAYCVGTIVFKIERSKCKYLLDNIKCIS